MRSSFENKLVEIIEKTQAEMPVGRKIIEIEKLFDKEYKFFNHAIRRLRERVEILEEKIEVDLAPSLS